VSHSPSPLRRSASALASGPCHLGPSKKPRGSISSSGLPTIPHPDPLGRRVAGWPLQAGSVCVPISSHEEFLELWEQLDEAITPPTKGRAALAIQLLTMLIQTHPPTAQHQGDTMGPLGEAAHEPPPGYLVAIIQLAIVTGQLFRLVPRTVSYNTWAAAISSFGDTSPVGPPRAEDFDVVALTTAITTHIRGYIPSSSSAQPGSGYPKT